MNLFLSNKCCKVQPFADLHETIRVSRLIVFSCFFGAVLRDKKK